MRAWLIAVVLMAVPVAGCGTDGGVGDGLAVTSPTLQPGQPIPTEHTCDGADRSPALAVTGLPEGTATVALVVDDPDAPGEAPFVHWLVWNIPASGGTAQLPEGSAPQAAVEGTHSAGGVGYTGPCPPRDDGAHTYRFTAYALDRALELDRGGDRAALEAAMADHVLAQGRLSVTDDR